jgi:hypothetical protein
MIKRLRFVTRGQGLSLGDFAASWVDAVALVRSAPAAVRPRRVVACTTLHHVESARHDGLDIAWFADLEALRRFEAWLASAEGARAASAAGVIAPGASTYVAEEAVVRGAAWLARRWACGAPKLKHMALARRAHGLSAGEFAERWRSKSGSAGSLVIPERARGHAYIQNHALEDRGVYDAINEVYFDDLEGMRARVEFFREQGVVQQSAELVREAILLAVSERVVYDLTF